jgi:hypothetical protein
MLQFYYECVYRDEMKVACIANVSVMYTAYNTEYSVPDVIQKFRLL